MAGKLIKQVWQHYPALYVILLYCGLLMGFADAGERARPLRIGALTASWGPSPQVVCLRDGLTDVGYREHEQFVLGVRFTEGDPAALPAAAREPVQYGVDLIFADADHAAEDVDQVRLRPPRHPWPCCRTLF